MKAVGFRIVWNSIEDWHQNKKFYFSVKGQKYPYICSSQTEAYYAFINSVNKDACYLMYGIIPLISHYEHNVYREMIDKKMAILIKDRDDLKKVLTMSDSEIQEYRDNIYRNRDLFTFDKTGELLCKLLDENTK